MYTFADISPQIKETIAGYPVKDLRWNPVDSIYIGLVKCPIWGRLSLHDGYIAVTWRKNGTLTNKYGGSTRKDLYLKLDYEKGNSI